MSHPQISVFVHADDPVATRAFAGREHADVPTPPAVFITIGEVTLHVHRPEDLDRITNACGEQRAWLAAQLTVADQLAEVTA